MSKSDQFWQYAREAMLSACYAQTDEAKQGLLEPARTCTQAALRERESLRSISKSPAGPIAKANPDIRRNSFESM